MQEVEEEGPYKAPKTKDLKIRTITDKDGNKRTVFVDDQGNIVDPNDME